VDGNNVYLLVLAVLLLVSIGGSSNFNIDIRIYIEKKIEEKIYDGNVIRSKNGLEKHDYSNTKYKSVARHIFQQHEHLQL
jgi:hypothetical protein